MELTLSWDLFVIVFFALVITYSFIIGKHESVKIIIATYIAVVASQGLGNAFERLSSDSDALFNLVGVSFNLTLLATTKLLLFVVTVVFLAVRGGFEIEYHKDGNTLVDVFMTAMFGFVTAGLMLSTLMTFVADRPLLDKNIAEVESVAQIMASSKLMEVMVIYQDLWFALPAIVLLIIGFWENKRGE